MIGMSIPRRISCTLFIVLLHVNTAASAVVLGFVFSKSVAVVNSAALSLNNDDEQQFYHTENENPSSINRRSALEKCGGIALSSLLLSSSTASVVYPANAAYIDYDDTKKHKKRILITGSNSGIGLNAAQRMVLRGHEVVLACRTIEKAKAAADRIKTNIANDSTDAVDALALLKSIKLTPRECDLADLSSIDTFVQTLSNDKIMFDAICYNAGIARNVNVKDMARTKQGYELTVGTNHLGHFYLNHLLTRKYDGLIDPIFGRIVVTASSVHDPDSPGGGQGTPATLGNFMGFEKAVSDKTGHFDMVDGGVFNADKAYKDSKLCNVLFTRELQRRLKTSDKYSNIKVNSFTPGLIVGTGLFREQNKIFTKVFDIAATKLLKVGETTSYGGGALEYMTLSPKLGETPGGLYYYSAPGSGKYGDDAYGRQFDVSDVSKEARACDDDGRAKRFWELSEKLVGV